MPDSLIANFGRMKASCSFEWSQCNDMPLIASGCNEFHARKDFACNTFQWRRRTDPTAKNEWSNDGTFEEATNSSQK